jgi:PAS domain S-box-containing protein
MRTRNHEGPGGDGPEDQPRKPEEHHAIAIEEADTRLSRGEEKFRTIFDSVNDAIVIWDLVDRSVLDVNDRACQMLRHTRQEMLRLTVSDVCADIPHYTADDAIERIAKASGGEGPQLFEWFIRDKFGRFLWIEVDLRRVNIGGRVCLLMTARDITERKAAAKAVYESEEKFRLLFEKSFDPIVLIDGNQYVDCNEVALKILGATSKDQIIGLHPGSLSPERQPDGRLSFEKAQEIIDDAFREGGKRFEWMRRTLHGREFWVDVSITPIPMRGKQILYTLWRDISEQKRNEAALRLAEQKYRDIFENAVEGIFQTTPEGRFLSVNPAMARIHGYDDPEELITTGADIAGQLFADPEDRKRYREQIEKWNGVLGFETQVLTKDGGKRWISLNARAVRDSEGNIRYYEGMANDITERKSLEAQLLQAQKMEAIGTLAAGIAHDFSNILMALMGYANLLKARLDQADPRKVYVDQIFSCTGRAANLTQSLLTFGRKQKIDLKPQSVNTMLTEAEQLLRRLLPEDITFTLSLGEDAVIMADITQIDQILMNLVTNARDAMPQGGHLRMETRLTRIDDELRRRRSFGTSGDYLSISISDTGSGIDEETQKRIFEPFFTTKEVGKGSGLGLSIVYGIVKQHNGYIEVTSKAGEGTTFHLLFPLESEKPLDGSDVVPDVRGGAETLLLAEDDGDIRRISAETLKMYGYSVIEAVDGQDAYEKFMENKGQVDLLILDVVMPRKNGREAYEQIRKIRKDILVIYISGYARDIVIKRGIRSKSVAYLPKPVTTNELLTKVREVLDRRADKVKGL